MPRILRLSFFTIPHNRDALLIIALGGRINRATALNQHGPHDSRREDDTASDSHISRASAKRDG